MKALGDNKLMYLINKFKDMFAPKDHTHDGIGEHEHNYAGSDTPGGSANSANKLDNSVTFEVDLSRKKQSEPFDGTGNVVVGVTKGPLPVDMGGTGVSTYSALSDKLGPSMIYCEKFNTSDIQTEYVGHTITMSFPMYFKPRVVIFELTDTGRYGIVDSPVYGPVTICLPENGNYRKGITEYHNENNSMTDCYLTFDLKSGTDSPYVLEVGYEDSEHTGTLNMAIYEATNPAVAIFAVGYEYE